MDIRGLVAGIKAFCTNGQMSVCDYEYLAELVILYGTEPWQLQYEYDRCEENSNSEHAVIRMMLISFDYIVPYYVRHDYSGYYATGYRVTEKGVQELDRYNKREAHKRIVADFLNKIRAHCTRYEIR